MSPGHFTLSRSSPQIWYTTQQLALLSYQFEKGYCADLGIAAQVLVVAGWGHSQLMMLEQERRLLEAEGSEVRGQRETTER